MPNAGQGGTAAPIAQNATAAAPTAGQMTL